MVGNVEKDVASPLWERWRDGAAVPFFRVSMIYGYYQIWRWSLNYFTFLLYYFIKPGINLTSKQTFK